MDVGAQKMEGFRLINKYSAFIFCLILLGCASKKLKNIDTEKLAKNEEFENQVKIFIPAEDQKPSGESKLVETEAVKISNMTSPAKNPTKAKTKAETKSESKANTKGTEKVDVNKRQPDIEPSEGFVGRRPIKDPFRAGEKVVHRVHYFNVTAGTMNIEVKPFAEVNGKKSYNFFMGIKTSSLFSSFYSVNDTLTTLVDFETLVPSVFTLHVREKSQVREARAFFDFNTLKAKFWEKKVTAQDGEQERKLEWDMLPYSQNVYSTVYYLRTFQWDVGKEIQFRIAHDNENLIFKATAIRKERIKTDIGEFNTIVIRPQVELKGKFQPTGDNYMWLSDDDRKYILKIESKIRIGTLVSEVIELNPGQP
jgi:hypothetical protein